MRDPKRIRRILAKLATAWECTPDQRLGQLIQNLMLSDDTLFYIEDDDMERRIEEWVVT